MTSAFKRSLISVFGGTMLALAAVSDALAGDLADKASRYSVSESLDRLVTALEEKGIGVIARIDHAANAATIDQTLRPTAVLLFGNPRLGTALMQARPRMALDLPMKVLAWQDASDQVWLTYLKPAALAARYGLPADHAVIGTMAKALDALTDHAAGS